MGHDRTRIVDSNHFHEARERAERDDMRTVRPSSLVYIVVGRRPGLAAPRGSSASANMVARRRTGVVITDFHAKYFAYEITKRCSSGSVEKLTAVLADAQVDLNPHQIEAALFAFRSPFSKGAILADEVGPRKTIPSPCETINSGPYRMAKGVENANTYRVGHSLAQRVRARSGARTRAGGRGTRLRRERQEHRDSRAAARALGLACLRAREHDRAGERGPCLLYTSPSPRD